MSEEGEDKEPEAPEPNPARPTVEGERSVAMVSRTRAFHARVNNWIAMGLMLFLGAAVLMLYYGHLFAHAKDSRLDRDKQLKNRATGDMNLPRLHLGVAEKPSKLASLFAPLAPEVPASEEFTRAETAPLQTAPTGKPPMTDEERELSAPVLWRRETGASAVPASYRGNPDDGGESEESKAEGGRGLGTLLQGTATPSAAAHVLPTQRLLLPKGSSIECTLETAIDSTLPGLTTCVTAVDVFGADGRVVLLERGTKLVGETRTEARQGQARVFVLWSEARTPTGVVIPLASPGTDAIGRAGVAGMVDRHFAERFGAAILVSVIDGAIQAGVAAQRSGNGNSFIVDPQASRDVMTSILRETINIPPTIRVNQGARVAVLVARDLDFRSVYRLQARD